MHSCAVKWVVGYRSQTHPRYNVEHSAEMICNLCTGMFPCLMVSVDQRKQKTSCLGQSNKGPHPGSNAGTWTPPAPVLQILFYITWRYKLLFSSIQNGIYGLGKAHRSSDLSLESFSQRLPLKQLSSSVSVIVLSLTSTIACISICAHVNNPKHCQPHHCLDTRQYRTHWR